MAKAVYIQPGNTIDFVNATASKIERGDIVTIAKRIGIASTDILPNGKGTLELVGVFSLPTSETIPVGTAVYWTGTAATATAGTNALAGIAVCNVSGAVHVKLGG